MTEQVTAQEFVALVWEMLIGRAGGPMTFRVIMQPAVAAFFAIRAGLSDAREGRTPYFFWAVFTNRARRPELFRLAWRDVGRIFIVAFVLDMIYELRVYHWVYPGQALVVALVLAILPYLMIRGPVTRIARALRARSRRPDDRPI
jgi:hypothetical protein